MGKCNILLVLLVFVTILEALLFALIPGGWSSYIYVLIDKGFYSELCTNKDGGNFYNRSFYGTSSIEDVKLTTVIPFISNIDHVTDPYDIHSKRPRPTSCKKQQEKLHQLYTIAVTLLDLFTVSWGPLLYKFGIIGPKILSMILMICGSLMLGLSNSDIPFLIVPGMIFVGVGGLGLLVINIKVSSILPIGTGLYVAVLNGACDSSVITFSIFKLLHETGMPDLYPFIGLIILHVIISGSSLTLHKVFDKQEKITTDAIKIDGVKKEEDIAIKVDILELNSIKNSTDNIPTDTIQNSADKSNDNVRKRQSISLKDSLCSLLTLSMLVWMSILMLYFFLYLGTINTRLLNTYPDKVSHFTNVLAYTMFGGIVTAIIPGSVAEWQIKKYKDRKKSTERSLMPNILPMTTASLLALVLTVLSYFKSESVFYAELAVLTVFRSFLYSSAMSFVISA